MYLYLLTIPVFFLIDLVWLGFLAKDFYQNNIGHLLGPVQWTPAVVFYLLYIIGILIFAVVPALNAGSIQKAMLLGALFGFFCYATYDLTNYATLKDWPLIVVVADIIWGTFLTGSVATISFIIGKQLL
jgi:uncharacterized membrane protein